jgi:hypothetical protein
LLRQGAKFCDYERIKFNRSPKNMKRRTLKYEYIMKRLKDFNKENSFEKLDKNALNLILGGCTDLIETSVVTPTGAHVDYWDATTGFDECDIYVPNCLHSKYQ